MFFRAGAPDRTPVCQLIANTMNQLKYILLAALCALFVSCGEQGKDNPTDSLTLNPTSLSFAAKGASAQSVTVTASGTWSATPKADWIQVSTASGSFSVTVSDNESEARAGKISVTCGSTSKEVFVSQEAGQTAPVEIVPNPAAFDGNKRSSTTYQILIYTFADSDGNGVGDFKGIQNKLDYLDEMGVTALWLSPAHPHPSGGGYHGYSVNDYNALNPLYGTEDDFKNLIDAAHAKNIQIYMDYVINHSGNDNAWFKSASSDVSSPYRDYYIFSSDPQGDIADRKIPMLLPGEGDPNPYSSGEWFATGGSGRYKFHLNWVSDTAPTITVTATTEDVFTGTSGKYLYFGNNVIKEFKSNGDNTYDLVVNFESDWGFLIRTSSTDWGVGKKYGAPSGSKPLTLGTPFTLARSTSNFDPGNVAFGYLYHGNFGQSMPDLNYGPVETAETSPAFVALAASADKWINMGVDGFRLDAVKHIYHNQWSNANPTFLKKWYDRCNATFTALHSKDIFMVGEVLDSHNMEKNYYAGLPSLFEFGFRDNVLSSLKNGSGSSFVSNVTGFIKDHKSQNPKAITSLIIGNHDINRVGSELGKNVAKEKQAAVMLLTSEGKPFVFQGDELGYWGDKSKHGDADIRMPICWDKAGTQIAKKGLPDGLDGYTDMVTGNNSVEAQSADAGSILNVYQSWSRLRNTYPALAEGEMKSAGLSGNSIASWYMTAGSQKLLVIHNVAPSSVSVSVSDSMDKPIALLGTGTVKDKTLTLGGNSSVVFEL